MDRKRQKTGNEMPDCGTAPKKKKDAHEHHTFTVKFKDGDSLTVECKQPSMLLEAIKSSLGAEFKKYITDENDENLLIKLGDLDASPFVSTHFPCSCVEEDVCLIITPLSKPVEAKNEGYPTPQRERYSIFYINKEGWKNTIFRTNKVFLETGYLSKLTYFCVYGEKRTTVEEALNRDGRFIEDLTDFSLSDENEPETFTMSTQTVNNLHGNKFKICLPKKKRTKAKRGKRKNSTEQLEQQKTAPKNPQSSKTKPEMKKGGKETTNDIIRLAAEEGISLGEAMKETIDFYLEVIKEPLRKLFPYLKQLMWSRFPDESFQEELELKEENFGKIQQSFSEFHRFDWVFELRKSVCLIIICGPHPHSGIEQCITGTGFVLFENFVLTNKHLFDTWTKGGRCIPTSFSIKAQFHFEKPDDADLEFPATWIFLSDTLDYALLQLNLDGRNTGQETNIVPPGLLKRFWSPPEDGVICIVGHPAGGRKEHDFTCVIKKDQREKAVNQNLAKHKVNPSVIKPETKNKLYSDIIVTYNTSMYHGASGSPVFDGFGRVFGLHSGGFFFNDENVIEYCYPLTDILKDLVGALKVHGSTELLKFQDEEKLYEYLKNILASVLGTSGNDVPTRPDQEEGNEGESQKDTQSEEEMDTS